MSSYRAAGIVSLLLAAGAGLAHAQEPVSSYPSRPVTIIVVVTAGGAAEAELRLYTPRLQEAFGRPFVFDYKPGAGGTIGYAAAAKSPNDGYTLLATTPAFTTVPALMSLSYDPLKDFTPVVLLGRQPGLLVVHPSVPATTLQEYVAYARTNPGKLNWATNGTGSTSHLVGAWLNELVKTDTTFVHYKGQQMQIDLAAGVVQVTANAFTNLVPLVRAGKLRPLALAGPARSSAFPDLRTAREQGVDFEYPTWVGVTAPAGTPAGIVTKLNAEFARIQKLPETQQRLEQMSIVPSAGTPEAFGRLINDDIERWKRLVRETGIKLEAQ